MQKSAGVRQSVRAVVVFALGVVACGREQHQPRLREVYAAAAARPVELRISGLPYVPAAPRSRGPAAVESQLQGAAYATLGSPSNDAPSRALALLTLGKAAEAVEVLQRVTAEKPDAAAWNDLAVALHARGRAGDTKTMTEALAAADRALRFNPRMPEALFNRAAVLDALGWREAAVQAWERYLSADGQSKWAAEARGRAEQSRTPTQFRTWQESAKLRLEPAAAGGLNAEVRTLVRTFPQQSRTTAETIHLADWGRAVRAGKTEDAWRSLAAARAVGDALVEVSGERLLHDAVAAAERNPAILAAAHADYYDARILISRRKLSEALPVSQRAEEGFRDGRSPMELVARYYRAGLLFDLDRPAEGQGLLDSIRDRELSGYPALRAQVLWEQSMRMLREGEAFASLAPNAEALALFERLGERDNLIRIMTNRMAALTVLGRDDETWRLRGQLFSLAGDSGHPDSIESVLHNSAFGAAEEERFDLVHSLLEILSATTAESPVRRYDIALMQTLASVRLGFSSPVDLEKLRASAKALPDHALQRDGLDEWNYVAAVVETERDPARAVTMLSQSIAYRERKRLITLPETYAARGTARQRAGKDDDAIDDFDRALSLYEQQRAAIAANDLRDTFFSSAAEACAKLLSLQVKHGRQERAFVTSERCRARVLADLLSTRGRGEPLDPGAVCAKLPEGTVLLHYNVLEERPVVFVLSHDRFTAQPLAASKRSVEDAAAHLIGAAGAGDEAAAQSASAQLHTLLIAPIETLLASARKVVVVPDDATAAVPFSALRSNRTRRYLLEDHAVTIAPSATAYAAAHHPVAAARPPRVTVVADPAFDPAVAGDLARLPGARGEAAELARIYPGALLLVDRDATPGRFLRAAEESDLIHVASHALVSTRDASLSLLAFAPAQGDDGLLTLAEIRDQKLRRQPLIVLAGCRTGMGGAGKGSIRSLALAFLAGGARGVVGSLWDVDDARTRVFSAELHKQLSAGLSTPSALREAQLTMLRSSTGLRDLKAWSGFQLIGFE